MPYIAVKGMNDVYGSQATAYSYIESVFAAACELYGYHKMMTPVLEYTEVFSRSTGEGSDVVRKEMYTFLDKAERSVTLRPEFTAGVARAVCEHKLYAGELPLKEYYFGPVFRYERPQLGRYRQFYQAGVECIGQDSARVDAEVIVLTMHILGLLGFQNLKVKINSLGDAKSREAYKKALTDYFASRIDTMCEDCHERLRLNPLRILDCKVPEDQAIAAGAPKMKDYLSPESQQRLAETLSIINDVGVEYEIDDSLVRGLDYYGEVVYEVHAKSATGVDYGALLGGGHYDGLISEFGGPALAGMGFAFGVERIYNCLQDEGLLKDLEDGLDVYVMPIGEKALDAAFSLTTEIRGLGYAAETPLEALKLGSQFKKAEKRGAKFALIVGEDELAAGEGQLKNLAAQTQKTIKLDDLEKELDDAFKEIGDGEEDDCHQEHKEEKK